VLGDAIQQVILNVVINAAEAIAGMSSGRAFATIETASTIRARSRSRSAMAARRERGRARADLRAVRHHKTTGLGMGLSISRSIVQAHGGRIWATRNGDGGLTMHIELPCEETGSPA